MANSTVIPRRFIILAIVLPLATLLGYLMATPEDFDSIVIVGLMLGSLLIPFLLKWHHFYLIVLWNASMNVFVLPGQPSFWVVLAGISFGISILERGLHKQQVNTYIPSIVWPLLILVGIMLFTAKATGGFGLRSMGGSSYGAKRYFLIAAAVIGYFALTSQRVPLEKARKWTSLFFAASLTAFVSNIIYLAGPLFYFLYAVFPVDLAMQQVMADYDLTAGIKRFVGFGIGGQSLIFILVLRYGIRGILSLAHPWRFVCFAGCLFITTLGGFRSSLVILVIVLVIQYFLEGLHRTRLNLYLLLVGTLLAAALIPSARHLPLSIQRSLSFLPLDVDPVARHDAELSTDWRVQMWGLLWPEVPPHLFLGKGCSLDPTEMYLMNYGVKYGFFSGVDEAILQGIYHNGPLTLLIQFGGFAAIAFLWFGIASLRTLYHYYQHGPPQLRLLNTFLLSCFLMRFAYFFVFYGHFAEDLFLFTGIIGLAVSINGKPVRSPVSASAAQRLPGDSEAVLAI